MKAVSETAGKQQKCCVFWDIGATLIFALWCPSHAHISMGCTVICLVGRLVSLVDKDVCGRLGHYLKGQRGVWCHPLFCLAPSKLYQALLLMWYFCDRRGLLINNDLVQDGSLRKWLKRVSNKLQKVSLQLAQTVLLSFPKQLFQKVSMQKYEKVFDLTIPSVCGFIYSEYVPVLHRSCATFAFPGGAIMVTFSIFVCFDFIKEDRLHLYFWFHHQKSERTQLALGIIVFCRLCSQKVPRLLVVCLFFDKPSQCPADIYPASRRHLLYHTG